MGDVQQNELRLYFCAVGELRQAVADQVDAKEIQFLIEEIQGIALNTDSAILRERCVGVLRQYAPDVLAEMA